MKKWLVLLAMAIVVTGFTLKIGEVDPVAIKTAVNKSLPLLQSSSHTFLVNAGGCHSCHGQGLGGIVFAMAKEKNFEVQDSILNQALDSMQNNYNQRMEYLSQNGDPAAILITGGYDLWAFDLNKIKPNKTTNMLAKNILNRQRKDGSWVVPNPRPPIEYYAFSGTAMAIRLLPRYLPEVLQRDLPERIERAKQWLIRTNARANEERAFQLLGLKWSGAEEAIIREKAKLLIQSQRLDGGWSQLDSLQSDAYATGQSLYALYESGVMKTTDPVYQKGIAFLLKTQFPDGSWNVQTRSFPVVPYVDSGFPHDDNEFISAAGTNWAMMALLVSIGN